MAPMERRDPSQSKARQRHARVSKCTPPEYPLMSCDRAAGSMMSESTRTERLRQQLRRDDGAGRYKISCTPGPIREAQAKVGVNAT